MTIVDRYSRALFFTVGLGIAAYCVAEASMGLAIVAIPVWALSWVVTQGPRGKPLPRLAILAMVFAATAQAVISVVGRPEDLVVAIARYLVWLHLIKLFDRVEPRDQAQLITMSIFLVIGACLTSNSLWLGALLLVYLPALLWTVMLHQLSGGQRRLEAALHDLRPSEQRVHRAQLIAGRTLGRDLAGTAIVAGVCASVMAGFVFVFAPRQWGPQMGGAWPDTGLGSVTGFQQEVTLGGAGLISDSSTPVLEMTVTDRSGRDVGASLDRVLLRGSVLDEYADGQWRRSPEATREQQANFARPGERIDVGQTPRGTRGLPVFVQRITFRNKQPGPLFAMNRPLQFTYKGSAACSVSSWDQTIDLNASGRVVYEVHSAPDAPVVPGAGQRRMPPLFRDGVIQAEAALALREAGLTRDPHTRFSPDDARIAEALERHLQSSYEYTTEMTPPAPDEDPIEMFLVRTRRGHCEYFASAMAAMCRSVGIDARVVTGYVAVERTGEEEAFIVRESNAHAWTEVRVSESQWRTFDPSPPDGLAREHQPPKGLVAGLRSTFESIERFWIRSIVGFEDSRRASLGSAPDGLRRLASRLGLGDAESDAGRSKRERGGVLLRALGVAAVAFGIAVAAGFGAIRILSVLYDRWRARRRVRLESANDPTLPQRLRQAGFYAEFEARLKRAGLGRPAWRGPMRHAESLRALDHELGDAAVRLVQLYYSIRFGRRTLASPDVGETRSLLASVDARLALRSRRSTRGAVREAETRAVE